MKTIFITALFIVFCINEVLSQVTEKEEELKTLNNDSTDGWEKGGMFSLTFGQSSFSKWSAGGVESFSFNTSTNLFGNYKKGKLTWDNTLDIGYGRQYQGEKDKRTNIKTDDKLDLSSKLGYKATKNLYYAALINFKTQFTDGFENPGDTAPISRFMAPAYLLGAVGVDYKPKKFFSAFIAPLTGKTTFVFDQDLADNGSYGVDSTKNLRNEFGGYIRTVFTKDIVKNVNLTSKLDIFMNYIDSEKIEDADLNWELLIGMKINKFLSANLNIQFLWDTDQSRSRQMKEIFGLGFSMKF